MANHFYRILVIALLTTSVFVGRQASAVTITPTKLMIPVEMVGNYPGKSFHLQVLRLDNPNASTTATRCDLWVHGMSHGALALTEHAQAVLGLPEAAAIKCILIVSLPGHDASELPAGTVYGQLYESDYVDALISLINTLSTNGSSYYQPIRQIAGHSMGGQMIPMLLQRFKTLYGQDLKSKYGIDHLLHWALVPTAETPLASCTGPLGGCYATPVFASLLKYIEYRKIPLALGVMSDANFQLAFFSNTSGIVSPQVPTVSAIHTYNNAEPLRVVDEMFGMDKDLRRPTVDEGIENGYVSSFVSFSDDPYIQPNEVCESGVYLNAVMQNCAASEGFYYVNGQGLTVNGIEPSMAIHSLLVSNPTAKALLDVYKASLIK